MSTQTFILGAMPVSVTATMRG